MESNKTYYSSLFKKLANGQKSLMDKRLSEYGITYVQSLVIFYLSYIWPYHNPEGEASQRDIEVYLSLKGSTVTHILQRMEENGFILRTKCAKDGRINRLSLTEKGQNFSSSLIFALDYADDVLTQGMQPEEKTEFMRLLHLALANVEAVQAKN